MSCKKKKKKKKKKERKFLYGLYISVYGSNTFVHACRYFPLKAVKHASIKKKCIPVMPISEA